MHGNLLMFIIIISPVVLSIVYYLRINIWQVETVFKNEKFLYIYLCFRIFVLYAILMLKKV